jgi:hypothetical protein
VQNITRIRGIPTDRGYLYFQQDGLPLFHELDGYFFNAGDGMNRLDLMTDRVETVRGGPAPIYASTAAGIANVITRTGSDHTQGQAQLTLGTSGLYRLDAYQSGPLGHDTYYAVGGFLRLNEGYRDAGYPSDKGGQIRANILHKFSNGSLKLGRICQRSQCLLSLDPDGRSAQHQCQPEPYINYFTGTLNSSSLDRSTSATVTDRATSTQHGDLSNGRHMVFGNVALDYEGDFGPWHVSAKGGYTKGKNHFDALYSTSNPVDANTFAAGYLSAARTAFGSNVASLGYAIAGTNGQSVYNPAASSGLVLSAQYRAIEADFSFGQARPSITRSSTRLLRPISASGCMAHAMAFRGLSASMPVQSQPADQICWPIRPMARCGLVTDICCQRCCLIQPRRFGRVFAATQRPDTWDITDHLRIDLGLRREVGET